MAGRGKVFYLLGVTAAIFLLPSVIQVRWGQWIGLALLLALQIVLLLRARAGLAAVLRPLARFKWLFAFLFILYTVLPPDTPGPRTRVLVLPLSFLHWTLTLNLSGIDRAGLMCLQIATLLLASALVRLGGNGRDLVAGLESFRLPPIFVYSLDRTLNLLDQVRDRPRGSGGGKGRGGNQNQTPPGPGFRTIVRQVVGGDVSFIVDIIERNIDRASAVPVPADGQPFDAKLARDVAVVTGIALCMASLKFIKIFPGIPFASGYKLVVLFPLYVLAARLTHARWGATAVGSIMGVIGFMQGDGRLGLLEVLKHTAPGIVIDLGVPLVRYLPRWALGYCFLGLVAAIARTSTEFALVILLGARAEVYVFPLAKLIPNMLAGFSSGFLTTVVLRAFEPMIARYGADPGTSLRTSAEFLVRNDSIAVPKPPPKRPGHSPPLANNPCGGAKPNSKSAPPHQPNAR